MGDKSRPTYDELKRRLARAERELEVVRAHAAEWSGQYGMGAEAGVPAGEKLHRTLFETAEDAIFLMDRGLFVVCNPASVRMFGCDGPEDMIGRSPAEFSPQRQPDGRGSKEAAVELMNSALTEGPQEFEWQHLRKDGSPFYAEVALNRLPPMEGASLQAVVRDITDRKHAEEELRRSEDRLSKIMLAANDGMWDWNLTTDVVYFDPRYYEMAGYAVDEFAHTLEEFQRRVHPEDVGFVMEQARLHLAGEIECFIVEFRFRRKDGDWMWILGRGVIVEQDDHGTPLRFVGTHSDITARKRAEEERHELQVQLHQAQKIESVGRLAGGVAHDFNNMLTVIMSRAHILLTGLTPDDPRRAEVQEIIDAGERSADLTRQLLAFARRQTIAPEVLDLNESVDGMLGMLRRLIGEHIEIVWRPTAGLWPVRMDPAQVDQILTNLCVNVRDAIEGTGVVTITTSNHEFDGSRTVRGSEHPAGAHVALTVADDGCGINEEVQSEIFEPFFTTKEVGKGTGLGLSTVYGIVKQNNGYVQVTSEPGAGSRFTVYLPRCADQG